MSYLGERYSPAGIVVLPFKNDKDGVVTSAVQSGLLKLGWRVVERRRVHEVISESELQALYQYKTSGAEEIRRKLDADVMVIGEVTEYQQGTASRRWNERTQREDFDSSNTIVGFTAKAIVIQSAELLWDASILHDGGLFSHGTPIKADAIKAVNIVIEDLIKEGAKRR